MQAQEVILNSLATIKFAISILKLKKIETFI
jgi:hypothetical protein